MNEEPTNQAVSQQDPSSATPGPLRRLGAWCLRLFNFALIFVFILMSFVIVLAITCGTMGLPNDPLEALAVLPIPPYVSFTALATIVVLFIGYSAWKQSRPSSEFAASSPADEKGVTSKISDQKVNAPERRQ